MRARGSCFGGPRESAREEQVAAPLTFDEDWDYYRKLLGQQREAIKSEADIEALKYGLEKFPALRRVTMTSDAHGFLFAPKYETPMIRSFPYGFNYLIPNGWPYRDKDIQPERNFTEEQATAHEAMRELPQPESRWPRVLHQLATLEHHHITELLVQSNEDYAASWTRPFRTQADEDAYLARLPLQLRREYHALNPRVDYERPEDFEALLSRPGFRRLDMFFHVNRGPQSEDYRMADEWHLWKHMDLKRALERATDLEHFDIRFQIDGRTRVFDLRAKHCLCLNDMLPDDRWPKLQHFGLEMGVVMHEELISVLQTLPQTLRSVRLSHLRFVWELEIKNIGKDPYLLHRLAWKFLLRRIREDLDWRTRPVGSRPRISVQIPFLNGFYFPRSRYVCLGEEANDFVYGDGPNPFDDCVTEDGEEGCVGTGVIRDTLEPEFESEAIWY